MLKKNIPVNSKKSKADVGAVEAEGEDSNLKRAPACKHIRLLPEDNKLTGGGSPVVSYQTEN